MDEKITRRLDFLRAVFPKWTDDQIIEVALLFFSLRIYRILSEGGNIEDPD